MAEGLVFPFNDGQDTEAKDKIAAIAKQCVAIAREKYGYVRCADLKGNINCSEIIVFMAKTAEDIMKRRKTNGYLRRIGRKRPYRAGNQ